MSKSVWVVSIYYDEDATGPVGERDIHGVYTTKTFAEERHRMIVNPSTIEEILLDD